MQWRLSEGMDISGYIISEEYTVMQALNQLDTVEPKVLFVVQGKRFCATLTDGDVRRAILKGIDFEVPVCNIANYHPIFLKSVADNLQINRLKERKIKAAPILNDLMEITGIYIIDSENKGQFLTSIDVPVVIMAGGLGTRLYPYTKILPKALIPVRDMPISEHILQSFHKRGCKEFHMIINHKKDMIKAYYNEAEKEYHIMFHEEKVPLGTGGGIRLLKDIITNTFILTNCDILIVHDVAEIVRHHKEQHNVVTMVCSLKNFEIPYGIVNFAEGGEIISFEEKPKMSFFTNTGYYILEPDVFQYVNENEKIDMPDIIAKMKNDNQKIGIFPISENSWLDMGQLDSLALMEQKLKEMEMYGV